ncbi:MULTISPECIES: DUF1641 domain-containing protein [Bacillaceae]|uniref:DUF1641 domain-containing protein n=1 Tax=Bacillaceae TaxID=186817 RepID=UPI000E758255|nr:DUF1641 domain-containing protein [Bacillus sp. PK3_68]RJS60635.1 hypothetical protein CJ483_11585 [Bacillus sp. PK3_68]
MTVSISKQDWVDELNKPEVQASLQKLIEKLPDLTAKIEQADQLLTFGQSVLEDEHTMEKVKKKIDGINIDMNTLEAALRLLEKLPLLLELMEKLETVVRFVENVLADEKSIAYLQNSVEEYTEPIREKVEKGQSLWEEVQAKAEANAQHISLFTVLKWMKDPSVQRVLSYVQALIETLPKKTQ